MTTDTRFWTRRGEGTELKAATWDLWGLRVHLGAESRLAGNVNDSRSFVSRFCPDRRFVRRSNTHSTATVLLLIIKLRRGWKEFKGEQIVILTTINLHLYISHKHSVRISY